MFSNGACRIKTERLFEHFKVALYYTQTHAERECMPTNTMLDICRKQVKGRNCKMLVYLHGSGGRPPGCHGEGETGTGGDESQAVINSTLTGREGRSPDCPESGEAEAPGGGPGDEVSIF